MTDDASIDIAERIDRSFGDGPAAPPLDALLGQGHRALRRRRMSVAGAGLAAAVVMGGVVLWSTGDGGTGADRPFVDEPTSQAPTPDPDPWQVVPAGDPAIEGTELVGWDNDGRLKVREGVTVLHYADNPLGFKAPDRSAAMAVSVDGAETWLVTQFNVDAEGTMSSGTASEEARRSFPTFELWLDDQVAMAHGDPTLSLVRFGPDGLLETRDDDVTLIQQRADPDLGPTFAGPDDVTAVAEVRWGEERWYVLARQVGNHDPEYFPTAASVSAPTLDGFIAYARDAYANGGGLR